MLGRNGPVTKLMKSVQWRVPQLFIAPASVALGLRKTTSSTEYYCNRVKP